MTVKSVLKEQSSLCGTYKDMFDFILPYILCIPPMHLINTFEFLIIFFCEDMKNVLIITVCNVLFVTVGEGPHSVEPLTTHCCRMGKTLAL